jgi:mannobiose 2-epimerase
MTDNTPLPLHKLSPEQRTLLKNYKTELSNELSNIIAYWQKYTPDEVNGGFAGKIDNDSYVTPDAPKG